MAVYSSVLWQPDDELTSEKLNAMAQNEEYLYNSSIVATRLNTPAVNTANQPIDSNGMRLRVPGESNITKIVGVFAPFDYSGTATNEFAFVVPFPGIFTEPPIMTMTVGTSTGDGLDAVFGYFRNDFMPDKVLVGIRYSDNLWHTDFHGAIHLIAMGQ